MDIDILIDNDINVEEALEFLGDIDTYNETLNDFLEESKTRLPKIQEYKNNKDMENYAILVHAMKGDSKYLGFSKLALLSLNHQLKSEENDIDYVYENYDELITEANRVIDIVKRYLNK